MNLSLLLKIFAGLQSLFVLGGLIAPESMMESFGMTYSPKIEPIMHFALFGQIILIIITFQLPNWLGDNLSKVSTTYICIAIAPILLNSYHIIADLVPLTSAFYIENSIWLLFAILFYIFGKK
jgi:hypothetical protein